MGTRQLKADAEKSLRYAPYLHYSQIRSKSTFAFGRQGVLVFLLQNIIS